MAKISNAELLRQAEVTRMLGSPFVAAVLEAGQRQLPNAPQTAALIANWPGNPAAAAIAMRFNGALHALARQGRLPSLSALYNREHDDFDGAIGNALSAADGFIATWMLDPPQTNEVGRAAAILAALMVAQRATGCTFDLLELGSSCGLNLNLARYAYDLGGVIAGTPTSPVHVAPAWRGSPPPFAPVEVARARGVDLSPLNPLDAATRERLLSFIWADQRERAKRLEHALDLARQFPPQVDCANAVGWIARQLAQPQQAGECRTVFHSMVLQYLNDTDRMIVESSIRRAGERATAERPLAWISFEWTRDRREVHLLLTCWPDGATRHLATCHPYGDWVQWLD
ncbi:DUF2332 domain-containing protein [Sphingobium sufflavum]|uniref:DUF2332 domain-containing protein n=1 Tax=Sphingobium sufflavum TaxID=1129547 RepID=UPI001F330EAE|nr:DUF2332 family protein [Sphingobium sufflavum]